MGAVKDRIEAKLNDALQPEMLEVEDQSEMHRGHAGYRDGGETHFHVRVVASAFEGESRVARQRKIYAALADELADRVHALSIEARAPGE